MDPPKWSGGRQAAGFEGELVMRVKSRIALILLVLLSVPSFSWAASKSTVIRVSATVRPLVQMSLQQGVRTNFQYGYSSIETFELRPAGRTKVLSVTAL